MTSAQKASERFLEVLNQYFDSPKEVTDFLDVLRKEVNGNIHFNRTVFNTFQLSKKRLKEKEKNNG